MIGSSHNSLKVNRMPSMAASTTDHHPSLRERIRAWVTEFMQFGLVGALAFVVDVGLFNLLQHGPTGILAGHPNTSNAVAAATATLFSWVANRMWTYRGRTQENTAREALLFAFANAGGVLITQFCLLFTHHILGLSSPLADNIAAYVVGFGLATAFRFFFYHYIVFTGVPDEPAQEGVVVGASLGGIPEEWDEVNDGMRR
ncbi:GtrA family protein [Actinomyces slackii]